MRCLNAFAVAFVLATTAQAGEASLCGSLYVPDGIGLVCVSEASEVEGDVGKVTIRPDSGPFGDLSRMSLRRLDPGDDEEAWLAPEHWLRAQLTVDFTNVVSVLGDLAEDPDNPLAGSGLSSVVKAFDQALAGIGHLPLTGCEPVRQNLSDVLILGCMWGVEPIALHLEVRLMESQDDRYAINLWSMNLKRMRHFKAIANSFDPDPDQ